MWRERREHDDVTGTHGECHRVLRIHIARDETFVGDMVLECAETVDAGNDPQTAVLGADIVQRNPDRDVRLWSLEVVTVVLVERENCVRRARPLVDGLIEGETNRGADQVAADVGQQTVVGELPQPCALRDEPRREVDDVGS